MSPILNPSRDRSGVVACTTAQASRTPGESPGTSISIGAATVAEEPDRTKWDLAPAGRSAAEGGRAEGVGVM